MATGASDEAKELKLYSYWRSSCSCRVRIAFKLKGLEYEYIAVNLLKGDQKTSEFLKLNPVGYVPVLVDGDFVLADSLAILMYLEEKYPQRPLLPKDVQKKALNYQVANLVASNIQPLQNLPVLVSEKLGADEKIIWAQSHIRKGFAVIEVFSKKFTRSQADFHQVQPWRNYWKITLENMPQGMKFSWQICFWLPRLMVQSKFNVDMNEFPLLSRINEAYKELPAFQDAMPEKQCDTLPEARA